MLSKLPAPVQSRAGRLKVLTCWIALCCSAVLARTASCTAPAANAAQLTSSDNRITQGSNFHPMLSTFVRSQLQLQQRLLLDALVRELSRLLLFLLPAAAALLAGVAVCLDLRAAGAGRMTVVVEPSVANVDEVSADDAPEACCAAASSWATAAAVVVDVAAAAAAAAGSTMRAAPDGMI
jgi:hypothetical protein